MIKEFIEPLAAFEDPIVPREKCGRILDFMALNDYAEFQRVVRDATVIFAIDKNQPMIAPIYGRETMNAIVQGTIPNQTFRPVSFVVDCGSSEITVLLAATEMAKGRYEMI